MPSNPAILLFGRIIPSSDDSFPPPCPSSPLSPPTSDPPSDLQQPPIHLELSPRAVADLAVSSLSHVASDDDDAPFFATEQTGKAPSSSVLAMPQLVDNSFSKDDDSAGTKPDKLVSCPRCDSVDTKFCYFNNYNVKQPRHFCRNCQRYWTAGGTLRNVPIGAGRRKHKHPAIVVPGSDHSDSPQPNHFRHDSDVSGNFSDPGLHISHRRLNDSSPASSSLSSLHQQPHYKRSDLVTSTTQTSSRPAQVFEPKNSEEEIVRKAEIHRKASLSVNDQELPTSLMKAAPCCSSVTALPGVKREGGALTQMSISGSLCFPSPATWAGAAFPLMFPWPYMCNYGTGRQGVSPPQIDAKREASWSPKAEALFSCPPVLAAPVWTSYGWSMPWNIVWNANTTAAASVQTHRKRPLSSAGGDDFYVSKSPRTHHPEDELAARSMVSSSPSTGGRLETVQSRSAVSQPKSELINPQAISQTEPKHANPAAQARSVLFQELSC